MRRITAFLLIYSAVHVAGGGAEPKILTAPFEPPIEEFFKKEDRFAHPPEIVPPRFLFPFEFRRHGGAVTPAEVVILVQLDGHGSAKQLRVFSSRYEPFANSALDALKKAKWDCAYEVWFYYRHVYALDE